MRSVASSALLILLVACDRAPAVVKPPPPPRPSAPHEAPPAPPPAPQDNVPKIEPKVELLEDAGRWKFRVSGSTELPDGALLFVKIHYVKIDDKGDEEVTSLVHDGKPIEMRTDARDAAFEAVLGDFKRKPYPIWYRAVVSFDPEAQPKEIQKQVDVPRAYSARADIPAAPKETLSPILDEIRASLARDFETVDALYQDLQKQFTSITSGAVDASKWDAWKNTYLDRVQALKDANDLRFEIWAVFLERNGKLRLNGLIALLYDLVGLGSKALASAGDAREKHLVDAKEALDDFKRDYFESINFLGLAEIPDAEALKPLFDEADALLKALDKSTAADVASLTLRLSQACTQRMQTHAQDFGTALLAAVNGDADAKARAETALTTLRGFLK